MVTINVYKPIDSEDIFMSWWGVEDWVFSADTIHRVFDKNPKENEFKFNINCDGGSVHEGLRIYDVLRTSGKTIHTNIEGGCHSMAIVLLLAAPKENRSANRNARALIHKVRTWLWDDMTGDELIQTGEEVNSEEETILDIYEERTGTDRETLEGFMEEEKMRDAEFLKEYGFISKINNYTTNFKRMNKKTTNVQKLLNMHKSLSQKIKTLLEKAVNYDFTDEDGNVLFSTEREDDTLEVGMEASPDGTYELPDGRTVTIEGGKVTDIQEGDDTDELENLRKENDELRDALKKSDELNNELSALVRSTYNAKPRVGQPDKKNAQPTAQQVKDEISEKRKTYREGRK